MPTDHRHDHAFASFNARRREGLTLLSRRNLLKAGLAGIAGLALPDLLRHRAAALRLVCWPKTTISNAFISP